MTRSSGSPIISIVVGSLVASPSVVVPSPDGVSVVSFPGSDISLTISQRASVPLAVALLSTYPLMMSFTSIK